MGEKTKNVVAGEGVDRRSTNPFGCWLPAHCSGQEPANIFVMLR